MAKILILHGPNLNPPGEREPMRYDSSTLAEIDARLAAGRAASHEVVSFQSNAEHYLVGHVQGVLTEGVESLIVAPIAFPHTSIALRDALLAVGISLIEPHLSNVHACEAFRRQSYFSDADNDGEDTKSLLTTNSPTAPQ